MDFRNRRWTMSLGAFVHETGQHVAGWRHPDAHTAAGVDFGQMLDAARTAERGLFDLFLMSDTAAISLAGDHAQQGRFAKVAKFEPIKVLSALAALNTHIGLVGTVSSTYSDPYLLARQFGSVDQISGGRAGWNLVTSNNEAEALNHSRPTHATHADRYDRAVEFAAVVQGLWESWDEDAFLRDKASGLFFDPAKLHPIHHMGDISPCAAR
jgi:alkanesulfonate monooxygenase SsuD/methylene tetrahydromethanopterin reductase-like flavin-dependent oxidoreductase (luciferase family)